MRDLEHVEPNRMQDLKDDNLVRHFQGPAFSSI